MQTQSLTRIQRLSPPRIRPAICPTADPVRLAPAGRVMPASSPPSSPIGKRRRDLRRRRAGGIWSIRSLTGSVRTSYKLLSDGRRQIGAFHLPGDVFGLESGTNHRLAAEAIVDTTVRLVKRRSLDQAAGTDVNVARKLWTMTAGDLRHAEDHMLLLGRKSAMERVASFLLEMDRRLAITGMMALPMCRRDIGDYLGLTLETVSRALSQLHGEGVLGFSGARQIVLRNRQRLRNMDA